MEKKPFTFETNRSRIVFGNGCRHQIADELVACGLSRALVLSTSNQIEQAEEISNILGPSAIGTFSHAAMHTPVEVTNQAIKVFDEAHADCIVTIGGGSTTGLGKAIAFRKNTPQFVLPTTYAGSEVTSILGQTENGIKKTIKDPSILPEVVIYDPELTCELPVGMSVSSGLNAMAHAVEALYAQDRNPISSMMAVEGIRALKEALLKIVDAPDDLEARGTALYGAWLCGTVLGAVGMAFHHKICHTLGGSFDLPHAETHAILLPHTAAYNQTVAKHVLAPATALFGGDLGRGLFELSRRLAAPQKLTDIGFDYSMINRASDIAMQNAYWNPRKVTHEGIIEVLTNATDGNPPCSS